MKKILISTIAVLTLFTSTVWASNIYTPYNNKIMTRGMAVQMIYELAGTPSTNAISPFNDKKCDYEKAIDWAYENNIILGFGDGTCRPNENITRE